MDILARIIRDHSDLCDVIPDFFFSTLFQISESPFMGVHVFIVCSIEIEISSINYRETLLSFIYFYAAHNEFVFSNCLFCILFLCISRPFYTRHFKTTKFDNIRRLELFFPG